MSLEENVKPAYLPPHTPTTTSSLPPLKTKSHRKKSVKQKDIDTVLIVNPNSSGGLTGKGWNELYSEIKEAIGVTVEVALTKKAGDG
ncbi:MAG: hypothetical protein M3232_06085, partial [Thermoproteota archaeon]|nr:hypothetical protein [Thermoproteota archaeon]